MGKVYAITNTVTGKVYIGSTVNVARRFGVHKKALLAGKHHSPLLQNAWNKYGSAAFTFDVVEEVDDDLFLLPREQFWMWRNQGMLMNCALVAGSPIGTKRTEEQRAAKRAFFATPEGRAVIKAASAANTGRKQSDEERALRSRIMKGKKCGPEWTDERRKAHSIVLTGRKMPPVTQSTRDAISAANKGRKRTPEAIANALSARLSWIEKETPGWLEMLQQGMSFREIEQKTGRSRKVVSRACRAKQ